MPDISPTTGQQYYSGEWINVREIARSLNLGEGKLSKISQEMVNHYQERADRELDERLSDLYYTPIKYYNLTRSDGTTVSIFPGNIKQIALYYSTGLLLTSEFQGNEPNLSEAGSNYILQAQKALYKIVKFNERVFGQEYKSRLRTMPPSFQPPLNPEQDF